MNYGFLSLVPPLLAIIFAIRSKQVYLSLISGIFLGWIILHDGNIWLGFLGTLEGLVDVFAEAGNTRTIMFSRSEEHTSELQSRGHLVCRLLLEKQNK